MSAFKPFYDKSFALVIGIDEYQEADSLETARSGAEAMANTLADIYQFDDVTTLYDAQATYAQITDALDEIRFKMRDYPDARFVVYWAGHGVGIDGNLRPEGWLVTHDSIPQQRRRLLRMEKLADSNNIFAKHTLLILDTCHSGLALTYDHPRMVETETDSQHALEAFLKRKAFQVLTSSNEFETVTDAPRVDGHTPFTGLLLQAIGGNPEAVSQTTGLLTASSVQEYILRNMPDAEDGLSGPDLGILPGDGGGMLVWQVPNALEILPEDLRNDLTSDNERVRFYALGAAEKLIGDEKINSALREVLRQMALNEENMELKQRAMELWARAQYSHAYVPAKSEPSSEIEEVIAPVVDIQPPESPIRSMTEFVETDSGFVPRMPAEVSPILMPPPKMVKVPAGAFLMGTNRTIDKRAYTDEVEQFLSHIEYDYQIARYAVTVRDFRRFIDAGGYHNFDLWTQEGWQEKEDNSWLHPRYWNDYKWTGHDDLPVVGVSWFEAYAYIQWLNQQFEYPILHKFIENIPQHELNAPVTNFIVRYPGYRFPTEQEWEKASRGPDGRIYPWGNEFDTTLANTQENGINRTTPTRYHKQGASPYGCVDMAGNVWEWCLTIWSEEQAGPQNNDPMGKRSRSVRGGSWCDPSRNARCSCRGWSHPVGRYGDRGFRLARTMID